MVNNVGGLTLLDTVLHFTAGPLLCCWSSSLHSTPLTCPTLDTSPRLTLTITPPTPPMLLLSTSTSSPSLKDVMAVDWVSSASSVAVPPGSAMRVILKLNENLGEEEKDEVLGVIGGIKEKFPGSFGENFSSARAKGFSIASIAVLTNELDKLDMESEAANQQKDLLRDKLDGVVVLDYVVPPSLTVNI